MCWHGDLMPSTRRPGRGLDHDLLEERDRLLQPLVSGHQAVFVLDADDVIVPDEAQVGHDVAPHALAVAVADRPEDPRALDLLGVLLRVEHAVHGRVLRVDPAVLRVDVVDAVAERADGRRHVDLLPEHVARIEVAADRPARHIPQPQHRLGVVDDEVGVHLDGDAHAGRLTASSPWRSSRGRPSPSTASRASRGTRAARAP